ncbi:MAG: hypothetical protein M3065_18040 [Actinomycetota bacterium]|nr:hypothetical protein [Actinomycetota bacterium]
MTDVPPLKVKAEPNRPLTHSAPPRIAPSSPKLELSAATVPDPSSRCHWPTTPVPALAGDPDAPNMSTVIAIPSSCFMGASRSLSLCTYILSNGSGRPNLVPVRFGGDEALPRNNLRLSNERARF